MDSLKRLSGAKDVSQDNMVGSVATFLVKFDAPPAVKLADVRKEVGKFTVDKVVVKLTGKATEKAGKWYMGTMALTGELISKLAELKGKVVIVVGELSEVGAAQSIALTAVETPAAK